MINFRRVTAVRSVCAACILSSTPFVSPQAAELETENTIPVVLTPTRLRQSLADVPASVTIITSEMMQRFGIHSIVDALRLVPGMALTQASGNDFRLNYHGTNVLVPRRMNVLIDGVSVYRPAMGRVDWKELPVSMEDIDKIEVTRGSNSASYGANSMLAIINIITKLPADVDGTTLVAGADSDGTRHAMARHAAKIGKSSSYRVTLDRQQDRGLSYEPGYGRAHDGSRTNRLNLRSVTEITPNDTLDLQLALVEGEKEVASIDKYQKTYPDISYLEYDLSARWRKNLSAEHALQVQAYSSRNKNRQPWTTCVPTLMLLPQMFDLWKANSAYATALLAGRTPSGGSAQDKALAAAAIGAVRALGARATSPTCVDADQDLVEARHDVELQDTLVLSDQLRMVSGIGARQDIGDSQTYLGGRVRNSNWRVFASAEYKPFDWLNLNGGGFFEKDQLTGSAFSPRLAANTHLSPNHTLRLVLSKGTRMPDIHDKRGDFSYAASNFSVPLNGATTGRFFQNAQAPGILDAERILSREIGYFANLPHYGLLVDAKVFDDKLSDLVSEKMQLTDFRPTNNNSVRLRGAELQVNYEPSRRWMMYLAYAFLLNRDATTVAEQTQYGKHSGAVGVTHLGDGGWRYALAYYGAGANTDAQSFYGRQDLTVSKSFSLQKNSRLHASFVLRHLQNRGSKLFEDFGRIAEVRYSSATQLLVNLNFSF